MRYRQRDDTRDTQEVGGPDRAVGAERTDRRPVRRQGEAQRPRKAGSAQRIHTSRYAQGTWVGVKTADEVRATLHDQQRLRGLKLTKLL